MLDNAPSHPPVEVLDAVDPQFVCIFLPPNVTALIQPMDQSPISTMKKKYRESFLEHLLAEDLQSKEEVVEFVKNWNLLKCCREVARAWNDIEERVLRNAWNKILLREKESEPEPPSSTRYITRLANRITPGQTFSQEHVESWVQMDMFYPTFHEETDAEILNRCGNLPMPNEQAISEPASEDEDDDEDDDEDEDGVAEGSETAEAVIIRPAEVLFKNANELCTWAMMSSHLSRDECDVLTKVKNVLLKLSLNE